MRLPQWSAELPEWRRLAVLVSGQLLVGIGLGLIWLAWAPGSTSYLLDGGNGVGVVIPADSESQVAADGRFVVLTVLAGVLFGLVAWRQRANRGPLVLAVLTVSSLLGSLLTMTTGELFSRGQHDSKLNTSFMPGLTLHATAAIFLQPLLAVLVYTMFVGLSGDPLLGRDGSPTELAANQAEARPDEPAEPQPAAGELPTG